MYFDDNLKAIALVDPGDGIPFNYIPSSLGILGSWSPDGTRLIYPELIFPDAPSADQTLLDADSPLYYSHLFMVDINSGRTLDVSPGGDWMVEDASPSFSPDGGWVAFTRKFLDPERWSPGRQVWLMSSDQAELIPLTAEPNALFSSLAWSPDSQQLAIMKKNLSDLGAPSEIWMVDIISGETSLIVEGGYLPEWLP
jgi:Tol biopolymer transport system component